MEYALIFDMDGVIIDSNPYHKITWGNFIRSKGMAYDDELFNTILSGKTGETSLRILFGPELSDERIREYLRIIDGEFREIFRNTREVEALAGVSAFLKTVRNAGLKTSLATSAPPENVDLVLDRLGLKGYFDVILDSTDVRKGKPDPEIYLSSVKTLGVEKTSCVVFEDSRSGIRSAIGAGLKVVGVCSSHSSDELLEEGVDLAIEDFNGLTIYEIIDLLQ